MGPLGIMEVNQGYMQSLSNDVIPKKKYPFRVIYTIKPKRDSSSTFLFLPEKKVDDVPGNHFAFQKNVEEREKRTKIGFFFSSTIH